MQNLNFPQQENSQVRKVRDSLPEDFCPFLMPARGYSIKSLGSTPRGSATVPFPYFTPSLQKIQNTSSPQATSFPGAQPQSKALGNLVGRLQGPGATGGLSCSPAQLRASLPEPRVPLEKQFAS